MQPFEGHFRDPHRVSLRKAARAAIVVPVLFALTLAADLESSALFVAFGSFAALVFADFGGALTRRFGAYAVLAVGGGVLVALGTALADTLWPAVFVTAVVAFAISFSGALGGYYASGGVAATLAFVLGVMTPGVEADLGARELGWVVGVLVAGVAALALWPVHQRDRVRIAALDVLREVSAALSTPSDARDLAPARAAADALTERAGIVYRPSGSITRERALVALVIATRRLVPLLVDATAADATPAADQLPEYRALARAVATTLQQSADALARRPPVVFDVTALEAARDAHTRALDRWAERAIEVDGPDAVVRRFDATFALRRLSLATVQIARSADMATSPPDSRTALRHAWLMVRAHCSLESVRLRNAARAGLGLALAVLVAKETSVEHSFWVVLGALSVLRSNALGTGATALQALLGACIGFGIASALMVTVGGDETVLWIALPVVVFLAGYTPGAVNFVVGQASFTVFVVVMFNVIVPEGWRTGLVRVQDVAIGAAISVGVGALLWPRGARGVARREFAALLRTGFAHLRAALAVGLDDGSFTAVDQASDDADDAATRATAALEDLALEHGGGHVDRQAWESVLLDALLLKVASDGITKWAREHDPADACGTALTALRAEGRVVEDAVSAEADRVERSGVTAARAAPVVLDVPDAIVACLATHAHQGLEGAIGLLWAHEWLVLVNDRPR